MRQKGSAMACERTLKKQISPETIQLSSVQSNISLSHTRENPGDATRQATGKEAMCFIWIR